MDPITTKKQDIVKAARDFFAANKYVVLSEVLSKEECKALTDYLFQLKEAGSTEKDPQCPLSDSIYGAPRYDDLLQKLAEPLGQHIGKKLLPTYTYARIYAPGEELKIHKDRPSCEYSATITLGMADGDEPWPIYFDEDKRHCLSLLPGELAMYSGCEVAHWRTPFKGKWQVQLFLHYVDAEGPFKGHYADGRKEFGKPKSPDNIRPDFVDAEEQQQHQTHKSVQWRSPLFPAVLLQSNDDSFPGALPIFSGNLKEHKFTEEECQKIIENASKKYPADAAVGGGGVGAVRKEIRDADLYDVPLNEENGWIFSKIANIVSLVNAGHFDYDLSGITHSLQLLHYRHKPEEKTNGHYNWHIDSGPGASSTRKISISVQLSDDKYYEGGELEVYDHAGPVIAPKEQGALCLFPSYMPHKVHPVTKGERWALVIWVHGYKRFR